MLDIWNILITGNGDTVTNVESLPTKTAHLRDLIVLSRHIFRFFAWGFDYSIR